MSVKQFNVRKGEMIQSLFIRYSPELQRVIENLVFYTVEQVPCSEDTTCAAKSIMCSGAGNMWLIIRYPTNICLCESHYSMFKQRIDVTHEIEKVLL